MSSPTIPPPVATDVPRGSVAMRDTGTVGAEEGTLENYRAALETAGFGSAFLNSLAVAIPATVIPITIAAFAAYAFSWMEFRGRYVMFVAVVGLMVVPLQMALIPILRLYTGGATLGGVTLF